ncbi:exocyst complex component SEC15B [Tanacetum coccineum]
MVADLSRIFIKDIKWKLRSKKARDNLIPIKFYSEVRDSQLIGVSGYTKEVKLSQPVFRILSTGFRLPTIPDCLRIMRSFIEDSISFMSHGGQLDFYDAVKECLDQIFTKVPDDALLKLISTSIRNNSSFETTDLAAASIAATSPTAPEIGVSAASTLEAIALGATGPVTVAGLTDTAVGATVVDGVAVENGLGKDAPTAADELGRISIKLLF